MASRTDGSGGYAVPSDSYTWRPPSPPHIHVPQAAEDEKITLPHYIPGPDADSVILKKITDGNHAEIAKRDWKYEWRRKAQPILSFLYLGPSAAARDIAYLKAEGITMLLAVRDSRSALASLLSGDKAAAQLGIKSVAIDVANYQELISTFAKTTTTINDHLISEYRKQQHLDGSRSVWGKVLVFCESGNERSACVVAAYMINMYNLGLVPALQYVQTQRFCVAFDDNNKYLLQSYHDIVMAKAAVANGASTQPPIGNNTPISLPNPKRAREEVEPDDGSMDLDDQDDEARFGGRTSFVPFTDDITNTPVQRRSPS